MRRGSLIFPLILVLLGVLFLLNNLNPGWSVFHLVGQYWPFILIAWGILRASEVLYVYLRGRPLPMAGMSGGEWFLVVFLVIVGGGIAGFGRFSRNFPSDRINIRGLEMFGEPYDYTISGATNVGTAKRVVIENLRGNVRVVGGDATEVRATGRNTVRAYGESEAKNINDQITFEVLNQGNQILVRTNHDRARSDSRISSDLDITVPKSFTVGCVGRYGDFDITGVTGGVDVDSDNAGVRLQEIGGNVRIDLRKSDIVRATNIKGSIEIKGRGDDLELENVEGQATILASYSGNLQFRNMAKPIRYESSSSNLVVEKIPGFLRMSRGELTGTQVIGPIRIKSNSKDIRLSEFTNALDIDVNRGDIELRPGKLPLSKIDARTHNGDLELVLPENAKFDLNARTDRGELDNSFGGSIREESEGRGGTMRQSTGQGPLLTLNTGRGKVFVRKATAGDSDWEVPEPAPQPQPSRPPKAPRAPVPPPVTQQ